MARITLINPLEPASLGCRFLAAAARARGHTVKIVFVPNLVPEADGQRYAPGVRYVCSEGLKEIILGLTQGSDIVGFSLLAVFHEACAELTELVRSHHRVPVIWGGVHATSSPEDCAAFADLVCVGDGEETLCDILDAIDRKEDIAAVPGLVFLRDGKPARSLARRYPDNIDQYPPPDYSFTDEYFVEAQPGKEFVIKMGPGDYRRFQKAYPDLRGFRTRSPYKTVSARGCPFTCTYCSMGSQSNRGFSYRQRSVENVIRELEQVMSRDGDLFDIVSFSDDTFMSHSQAWIDEFAEKYSARIGRPFRVLGFPNSVTPEKVEALCKAGCMHFGMGIESLAESTLGLFKRKTNPERVIEAANRLVEASRRWGILPPTFDVIFDNPYESLEDILVTYRRLLGLKRPLKFVLFPLVFFPGSDLYDRAVADGKITPSAEIKYRAWLATRGGIPEHMFLMSKAISYGRAPNWLLWPFLHSSSFRLVGLLCQRFPLFAKLLGAILIDPGGLLSGRYLVRSALRRLGRVPS